MRILIIDDSAELLRLIAEAVRWEGYDVVTAENGLEGLKFAGLHAFDLVVTDIFMPKMDGITLIKSLRKHLLGVPIIAISGGGQFGELEALKASSNLGATYTLQKPFEMQELIDLIKDALGPNNV